MNLFAEFHMGTASLAKLCFLEKHGKIGGQRVRLIRVFDPALISSGDVSKLKYQDLEEIGDRTALLFEGHIEKNGPVRLVDLRSTVAHGIESASDHCQSVNEENNVWLGFMEKVGVHDQEDT